LFEIREVNPERCSFSNGQRHIVSIKVSIKISTNKLQEKIESECYQITRTYPICKTYSKFDMKLGYLLKNIFFPIFPFYLQSFL
jgi:hypothetical protein